MKLEENFDEYSQNSKGNTMLISAVIIVCLILLLVIGLVVFLNRSVLFPQQEITSSEQSVTEGPDLGGLISGSTLVSSDLDIWEEYMIEDEEEVSGPVFVDEIPSEDNSDQAENKTLIERADGSSEWVEISQYLPQNHYDKNGFAMLDNRMYYYKDGMKSSYTGVEISKYQGYVDFNEVKRDGVDFVMIRLGQRGYSTGQIVLDDYFTDNMKRATDAGLAVGVTFGSQAVTIEEAEEEAEFVLQYLEGQTIRYPVVFEMEHISNDSARIDMLTKEDKTRITKAFLSKIEAAGYIGVISADKEWMFEDINYAAVSNYGVWLNQAKDLPDYPYDFQMWNYTNIGNVEGINGSISLSISFVDYTVK